MKGMPAAATAIVSILIASADATAQRSAEESAALATQVPIADVHFHLEAPFVPADIKASIKLNRAKY